MNYSSHADKIAEHGGFHEDDVHVALLVSNPALQSEIFTGPVRTTQIAPTILEALGLDPRRLAVVRIEGREPKLCRILGYERPGDLRPASRPRAYRLNGQRDCLEAFPA